MTRRPEPQPIQFKVDLTDRISLYLQRRHDRLWDVEVRRGFWDDLIVGSGNSPRPRYLLREEVVLDLPRLSNAISLDLDVTGNQIRVAYLRQIIRGLSRHRAHLMLVKHGGGGWTVERESHK
jgi:hypothetical protein